MQDGDESSKGGRIACRIQSKSEGDDNVRSFSAPRLAVLPRNPRASTDRIDHLTYHLAGGHPFDSDGVSLARAWAKGKLPGKSGGQNTLKLGEHRGAAQALGSVGTSLSTCGTLVSTMPAGKGISDLYAGPSDRIIPTIRGGGRCVRATAGCAQALSDHGPTPNERWGRIDA